MFYCIIKPKVIFLTFGYINACWDLTVRDHMAITQGCPLPPTCINLGLFGMGGLSIMGHVTLSSC